MKNFKRIISFAMAMIICSSFLLVNSGAEWHDYTEESVDMGSDYTSATAYIEINEWPQDTGSTDLNAGTIAHLYGYINNLGERFETFSVYVHLGITLEDYFSYSRDLTVDWDGEEYFAEAKIDASNYPLGEPYYAIIDLGSVHEVTVNIYTQYNRDYGWYNSQPFQDGDLVVFGISY